MNSSPEPGWYEIRFQRHLHRRWASWFDRMTVDQEADGVTILRGPVADQAALHGLLARLGDLGLPLLSVRSTTDVGDGPGAHPTAPHQPSERGNQP